MDYKFINSLMLTKYDKDNLYKVIADENGEELGIEITGMLTKFDEANTNHMLFTKESYDNAVNYYLNNKFNIPLCLFHDDSTINTLVGVVTKLSKDENGIVINAMVYSWTPSYDWVKNAMNNGMLQGFSNMGIVTDGCFDNDDNLIVKSFELLHVALVSTPADVRAKFGNTRFEGFEKNLQENANNIYIIN